MDAKLEQAQEMMQEAEERHRREKEYVFIFLVGVHMQFISLSGALQESCLTWQIATLT